MSIFLARHEDPAAQTKDTQRELKLATAAADGCSFPLLLALVRARMSFSSGDAVQREVTSNLNSLAPALMTSAVIWLLAL